MKYILISIVLILFIGCGSSSNKSEKTIVSQNIENNTTSKDDSLSNLEQNKDNNKKKDNSKKQSDLNKTTPQKKSFAYKYGCDATILSENSFKDSYIEQKIDNIIITGKVDIRETWSVSDIKKVFDNARKKDPTISSDLTMPSQEKWDSFSDGQKMLYLINKERCDRGIRPFEGVSEVLSKYTSQPYARLMNETNQFSHTINGTSPSSRMADAGVELYENTNTDIKAGEALAGFFKITGTKEYVNKNSIARSVYMWLYMDKGQEYGHRMELLLRGFVDNSGYDGIEGIIGVGIDNYTVINEFGRYMHSTSVVLDFFDPTILWENNLSDVTRVELKD